MIEPVAFTASLEEPALAEDATSDQKDEQLPTYNAYSVDGDVTGELVYVNYGVPEDYEELARRGIDVEGKIALARYGKSWRGIKPKVAAENGAIGCIIFSDPRDDGYFLGDVYPVGGYRGAASAQRGSVADMPLFPGDPLTPGRGATADAKRLKIEDAPTLTTIPVLPISYADAQPLLEALEGPVAPPSWRGALPLAYHLGPGPAKVRLQLEFDWKMATARDVIAVLPGKGSPDQWVIRGNHHDAWVNGAADPVAGLVAMMEEARAVAELTKNGWRPRRTIVYAAWDAEEPGLLGSVEWAEAHADELRRKAVAYINTDAYGRGFLQMGGSHTLERFMNQVTSDVPDPYKEMSVAQRRRAAILVNGNDKAKKEARERTDLRLAALGSGSDYTPFLQHLGIASLNLGFFGEGQYGQYHSIYDSFDHFTRFMDPDFRYGVALAKITGRTTLRLADADVLPFEFATLVETIAGYVDELQKLTDEMRETTAEKNRLIDEGSYVAAASPEETYVPPQREEPVPHLNFAPLENALESLRSSVQAHEEALTAASAEDGALPPEKAAALDSVLMSVERSLGRSEGLPGRSWYTHHVYAPGFYTGYGVKTLPGVREAIELRRWSHVEGQITVAAAVLAALEEQVERATEILAR
ncbi:MAG: folate hydrolase [Gemmatimonadetes bacterium]|nr:folate hydrolase [Gemmatimonadota bacterium]